MGAVYQKYLQLDTSITRWMAKRGIVFLRISLGIIFFWFGVLKFFPGISPAEDLAVRTIQLISFGMLPPSVILVLLATWECLIGLGMITGKYMRLTLLLLFAQMAGTFTPLLFFPSETWVVFPFVPTMEGQYIIKNLALISAGIAIGATVRGGHLESEPVRKLHATAVRAVS